MLLFISSLRFSSDMVPRLGPLSPYGFSDLVFDEEVGKLFIFSCSRDMGSPRGGTILRVEKLGLLKVPRTVAEWGGAMLKFDGWGNLSRN